MGNRFSISIVFIVLFIPALSVARKDPSDYTLRVQFVRGISAMAKPNPYAEVPESVPYILTGHGNVSEGGAEHAFDYTSTCYTNIRPGPDELFLARWKKPQKELELLVAVGRKAGSYHSCDLSTVVHQGVYVGAGAKLLELSQNEYLRWKTRHDQEKAVESGVSSLPIALLLVTSQPESADILVDGVFTGSTPSVLDLPVGAHTITVTREGFKPWERKMMLVTGRVRVNAYLDRVPLGHRN